MSLWRSSVYVMLTVTGLILQFFVFAGPYYTVLDSMAGAATDQGFAELNTLVSWTYWVFYYGYPSITVLGIIASMGYLFMAVRRRYYSTEEYYG